MLVSHDWESVSSREETISMFTILFMPAVTEQKIEYHKKMLLVIISALNYGLP